MALESIVNELYLPFTPEQVWGALADSAALARWLMPNDFAPRIGHRFTFRTDPVPPYFDGTVHCEVLEVRPPERLIYTWVSKPFLDTLITFSLRPEGAGTHLRLEHSGFDTSTPSGRAAKAGLSHGWLAHNLAERIGAVIRESETRSRG
jgi:uncharacterized protein YndB with AHSA1/START domain